jgi:hypothetical protein
MTSTKNKLQEELGSSKPKDAIHNVGMRKGGVVGAKSAGELSLSPQQAYNLNNKRKRQREMSDVSVGLSRGFGRDLLFVVMEQCKFKDKVNRYVQEVTCAPEPMAILCMQQQLVDMKRFCCNESEFCIMGVDPTFNLGEFSVTPIVYQHLLVQSKKSSKSPWMLGPILIHYKKEFHNYNFFFSSLVGLMPELKGIKAIGTDGELNIINAAHQQFRTAFQLRCFRHLQKNIERHLQEKRMSSFVIRLYIQEIFGWVDADGTRSEGLVDSKSSDEFQLALSALKDKWICREQADVTVFDEKSTFYDWFMKYKADVFCSSTLKTLREQCGLGSPPSAFYTNSNESINSSIKHKRLQEETVT